MITLDQLKDNYIMPVLNKTGLPFMIFTDAGDFLAAERRKNTVTEYINGLFKLTQSEIQKLGAGLTAVAIVASLQILVPCDDEPDYTGGLLFVQQIREALSEAFSQNVKLSITSEGKTYVGGVSYSLPAADMRNLRPMTGDSLIYTCTVTFAYLENALNATDITITIDGTEVPYTTFQLTRSVTPSADLYANSTNGEAHAYAENSRFTIDLETPASTVGALSLAIANHIMGNTNVNTPHAVVVTLGGIANRTVQMMFGECSANGAGVSNVVYKISLIPYASQEVIGG